MNKYRKCEDCHQEMSPENKSCVIARIVIKGKSYPRNSTYFDKNKNCHDCNILNKKGNFHHMGCDMERCPKCKGQLLGCGCLGV